jgi:hypothetical protein
MKLLILNLWEIILLMITLFAFVLMFSILVFYIKTSIEEFFRK